MTDAATWARVADPGRRVGRALEYHPAIGSTNDRARAALAGGVGDGLVVATDHQVAGRGRLGRSWLSPAGVNLAASVALLPRLPDGTAGLLGLAAGLAARDACRAAIGGIGLGLRWPNDVVGADGLKVAGLLVETSVMDGRLIDAVIGIGINVNWRRTDMPTELRERATSLSDLAGRSLDRVALLTDLLDRLAAEVVALESGASPIARIREASVLDGRWVEVEVGASRLHGRVAGIADGGALLLQLDDRVEQLTVGEVVAVRDAPQGVAV